MITHNLEAAAVGHRIVEMRDGRVVGHGVLPPVVTGAGT
jgi:ABC-type proline/glycine betaine transport system ATPase subunit